MSSVLPGSSVSSARRSRLAKCVPPWSEIPRKWSVATSGALSGSVRDTRIAAASTILRAVARTSSAFRRSGSRGTRITRIPASRATRATTGKIPGITCACRWLSRWVTVIPAPRTRSICARVSASSSPASMRPASARRASAPSGWNSPVAESLSDGARSSGRPCTRLRCMPTPSVRVRRARRTAFSQSAPLAMIDVEVTLPAACASTIPRVTPAENPKSSALMISRGRSGVAATPVIAADVHEVAHHPHRILREAHRGRLLIVAKEYRGLREREVVLLRDEQCLDVEAEPWNRDARKDDLRRVRGEALEPGLRVENSRNQRPTHHRVEHPAHHVARVEIREEGWAHEIARLRQHPARDGDIRSALEIGEYFPDLARGVREIGIGKNSKAPDGGAHATRDREPLAAILLVSDEPHLGRALRKLLENRPRLSVAAVIDENELRGVRLRAKEGEQLVE